MLKRVTAKPRLWTLDWTMDWTMEWTGYDHYQFSEAEKSDVTNRKHCVTDYFLYYIMDCINSVCVHTCVVQFSLVFPLV